MRSLITIISIIFLFTAISCHDEKKQDPQDCCGNPAIEVSFGNAHVYIPNIFTPNGDGINDLLPFYGDSISLITSFEIRDEDDHLVFDTTEMMPYHPLWDGAIDGEIIEGVYSITMTVMAEDGTVKELEGKVCNYPCSVQQLPEISDIDQCKFPSQVTDGYFDPTIPSFENSDCFD